MHNIVFFEKEFIIFVMFKNLPLSGVSEYVLYKKTICFGWRWLSVVRVVNLKGLILSDEPRAMWDFKNEMRLQFLRRSES